MNQLADVVRKMASGKSNVDLQALSSIEKASILETEQVIKMQPEVLVSRLEQQDQPTEWYSPVVPSKGLSSEF